jgi:peptidoglycan-associated lipoprotein
LERRIHFDFDRWQLTPAAQQILEAKATILLAHPSVTLRIEGHADERGSDEYNLVLSNKRAAEAKRFLAVRGVAGSRLEVMGFGEERPLSAGGGEDAWATNRRAEFVVVSGLPVAGR